MIKLQLERDQARTVEQNFLPYMVLVSWIKIREAKNMTEEYFSARVIYSAVSELERMFKLKLLSKTQSFTFNLTDGQGVVLYKLLMATPISDDKDWLLMIRQHICNILHKQLIEPLPDPTKMIVYSAK